MRQMESSLLSPMKKKDEWPRRYKAVYEKLYSELPTWKRQLVDEKHDRQCTDLAKEVIRYAEQENQEDNN